MNHLKKLKLQEKLESQNMIQYENRLITDISIRRGFQNNLTCYIKFNDSESSIDGVNIDMNRFCDFASIFHHEINLEEIYYSNQLVGKYIRLGWKITPEEDMHQLADERTLWCIRHIIHDDTFFI
jgi:hypothetical protein